MKTQQQFVVFMFVSSFLSQLLKISSDMSVITAAVTACLSTDIQLKPESLHTLLKLHTNYILLQTFTVLCQLGFPTLFLFVK